MVETSDLSGGRAYSMVNFDNTTTQVALVLKRKPGGGFSDWLDLIPIMEDVISRYMKDVVNRAYPAEKETVFMAPEEVLTFAQEMKWERKIDQLRSGQKKSA